MNIEDCEYITDLSEAEVVVWIISEDEFVTDTDKIWEIIQSANTKKD